MAEKDKKEEKKEGEAEVAAVAAPAKSNKKLFIIIGGVAFLLIGVGAPVLYLVTHKAKPEVTEASADAAQNGALSPEGKDDVEELAEGEEALGAIFPLDSFVVNLTGGKFIRLQAQLEFNEREIPRKFYSRTVMVRDAIISLLSSRSQDDILSSKGREQLKTDIKDIVNEVLKKEEVKRVYFTQLIVQ